MVFLTYVGVILTVAITLTHTASIPHMRRGEPSRCPDFAGTPSIPHMRRGGDPARAGPGFPGPLYSLRMWG